MARVTAQIQPAGLAVILVLAGGHFVASHQSAFAALFGHVCRIANELVYGSCDHSTSVGVRLFFWKLLKGGEETIMKKWQCIVCGFIYDEEEGLEEEGIAAGTRWEDIPEDWVCPECGVSKEDFEMEELA